MAEKLGEPTIAVSVSRRLNLGNYESVDVFVSLSGLKAGATQDEIGALLATGELAWGMIGAEINDQLKKYQTPTRRR